MRSTVKLLSLFRGRSLSQAHSPNRPVHGFKNTLQNRIVQSNAYYLGKYSNLKLQRPLSTSNPVPTTFPSANENSFYKRPLPTHLHSFSSPTGKILFKEAMESNGMESYWTLAEQFNTQSEPAYCGLATLSMVLNALKIDPKRLWKGPWRWFSEDLLDCCIPLEAIKKHGTTFDQFECLAVCNGAEVQSLRGNNINYVKEVCARDDRYLVVSFSRQTLGQTGDGHFATVAGYHAEKDLVLLMCNNLFSSHVSESLKPLDAVTNQSRGLFILSQKVPTEVVCAHVANEQSWASLYTHISNTLPKKLDEIQPKTVSEVISVAFEELPSHLQEIHSLISGDIRLASILEEVSGTKLFQVVQSISQWTHLSEKDLRLASLLFLAYPSLMWKKLTTDLRLALTDLCAWEKLPPSLANEVKHLRKEMLKASSECAQCGQLPSSCTQD